MPLVTCLEAALLAATAGTSTAGPPVQPVATYSIVARDPETGHLGVAVQSHWFSVGSIVTWAEAGVGAVATQSFARAAYGPEILQDLRSGLSPDEALRRRTADDAGRATRQVGVVDARGRVAARTGERCIASAGHELGEGFSVQANLMTDDGVVPAMAAAYRGASGDFALRLLTALEGAQAAGGDVRGRQSAALLIVAAERTDDPAEARVLELRVDDHPEPLVELRRLARIHAAYEAANAGDERLGAGDVAGALSLYERAEELYPENVELSYWRGIGLLQAGRAEEGLAILQRVFAREPRWLALGPRLVAAGLLPDDAALLERIEALAPGFQLRRAVAAADAGRIERDVRRLASFGTRHTLSSTDDPRRGIGAATRWVKEELERISQQHHEGRLHVELAAHAVRPGQRVPEGAEVVNVLGTLPGEEPDRLVVVSAHLDSRASDVMDATSDAPGANDDASGVAAILEAARLLGGLRPRASLVFMAVSGEEQGLLGSRAQAQAWRAAGREVVAMLTLDIVGGAVGSDGLQEPWRIRVFSEGVPSEGRVIGSDNDAPSRQLARYFARAAEAAVPGLEATLVFRQDRYLRGGDHRSFNELGIPAIRLTEAHENFAWQHQDVRVEDGVQHGDLPEFVDHDHVARVARATAATVGELALAPPTPRRVQLEARQLSPDSTLTWEGEAPAHAVLWRRTHEPDWTHRRVVTGSTATTLEAVSKDDWVFAVEAVSAEGHRSLAVYPEPRFR